MNIRKIVIPAAGFGTRFLPFTKSVPKELLPLVNKPALQQVIEEGLASDINNFCLIVNDNKPAIQDYFTRNKKLESALEKNNKQQLLQGINAIIDQSTFSYVIQQEMLGLGHAILLAKQTIGDEFFGVILPDDIIVSDPPCLKQLAKVAQEQQAIVIAVIQVPQEEISSYGIIKAGQTIENGLVEVVDIVEKPTAQQAFSNLAITGHYILSPAIFDAIEAIVPNTTGEIQLTDAIAHLIKNGHKVLALEIKGNRFDLGRPPGWFAANMYFGMKSHEYGKQIRDIVAQFCQAK